MAGWPSCPGSPRPPTCGRCDRTSSRSWRPEIRHFLVGCGLPHRRSPGPEPRRGRADHRDAPGVRLPARHDRVRHRPPVLRAQAAHRPVGLLAAAPARRAVRLPEPGRVRARRAWRTPTRRRRCPGPTASPRRTRCAGADRHVVAVIGDGALTGGMAWEALNNIAAGQDRRLVIVVNDNGRSYAPTIGGLAHHLDRAAHHARLRERPRLGQADAAPLRAARAAGLRGAARPEEGHQGRRRAAGHVRGPRPEVHRPGRRARRGRGGARPAPREGVRRAGDRARHHREGPGLRAGRAGRRRPVPRGRA